MNLHDASVGKADIANLNRSKARAAERTGVQNISPDGHGSYDQNSPLIFFVSLILNFLRLLTSSLINLIIISTITTITPKAPPSHEAFLWPELGFFGEVIKTSKQMLQRSSMRKPKLFLMRPAFVQTPFRFPAPSSHFDRGLKLHFGI